MGLFKSFKKMLAPIGGVVGFALGGPMGAALGSCLLYTSDAADEV